MKRLAWLALCLVLCLTAVITTPSPAAAHCHEGCCADMQQQVEAYCAAMGTSVRYFFCEEAYMGSCCTSWYDCYPPWA
jgi:hypothetical protein